MAAVNGRIASRRRSNGRRQAASVPQNMESLSHPPQINGLEIRHSPTLRFRATAAVNQAFTFTNLMDTMLTATTATVGYNMFQAVRIRRVRVWGISAIGTSSSVSVEFTGTTAGITGDQQVHSDTSVGVQPAHVDAVPSARALCSTWQTNSGAIAFAITAPAGSVIDVELSFRSSFAGGNVVAANALVAATAGQQYLRGLDGLATATSNLVPEYTIGQI